MSTQANPGTSPQKVGRYQIIGELGKGAMGLVYKALDPMIGRTVAMKTMRMDVHGMEADEMLKRFQNEARAAGVLNHVNIVTIYDAGEQDGMFYIAMEFIEGVTLHSMLAQQRVLPVDQVVDLSRQICAGLDYAHSHGVIHRDVKPANIMITPDKTVKIMDFGIAKAGGGLTSAGQVLGTPNYMSPEQVKGRQLDGRSDLFSFGVMLYEMVTGEKPFTGQNVTTIIYKIVNENPIPPRELDVTIHPGLSAVITRALAKNPDERYQTGAALVRDLANYKAIGAGGAADTASMALNAAAQTDKTVVFDSQAMMASDPGASAAAAPAAAPLQAIDSTVDVPKKVAVAKKPAAAAKKPLDPKLLGGIAAGVLVLVLIVGGIILSRRGGEPAAPQETAQAEAQQPPPPEQQAPPETPQETQPAEAAPQPAATPTQPAATKPKPREKPGAKPAPTTTASTPTSTPAQPAQPVAAPTTGDLQITSTPAGAQVELDSAIQGTTPFTASKLKPGMHTVIVSKPGYQTARRTIEVVAGKTTPLVVNLEASPMATVNISSEPAGAAILIDGKETGKVTPAQLAVETGEHRIVLRKQGYKDAGVTTPKLATGQSFNFAPILEAGRDDALGGIKRLFGGIPEGKGMANFKTTPKGAKVLIKGHQAGKSTPFKLPLDPGTYEVTFEMDGYKSVTRSVTIEKGKTAEVEAVLQKQ